MTMVIQCMRNLQSHLYLHIILFLSNFISFTPRLFTNHIRAHLIMKSYAFKSYVFMQTNRPLGKPKLLLQELRVTVECYKPIYAHFLYMALICSYLSHLTNCLSDTKLISLFFQTQEQSPTIQGEINHPLVWIICCDPSTSALLGKNRSHDMLVGLACSTMKKDQCLKW